MLISRIPQKISKATFRSVKKIYNLSRFNRKYKKTTLFIVGCQRSGTTLMYQMFERDLNAKVYGEFSKLSSHDLKNKIRLNSLDLVKNVIDRDRYPLIVLKPLVETQNTLQLLNFFEDSKALWMYRHYKDVVASNLKKFGIRSGINDLQPIVANDRQNWRVENMSDNVRSTILKHFSEDMNPYDAAALFWFVRNSLFFELQLDTNPNVKICRYKDLVTNPTTIMEEIYKFLEQDFPGNKIVKSVHHSSIGKGKNVTLSTEIDHLCQELWNKLNAVSWKSLVSNQVVF